MKTCMAPDPNTKTPAFKPPPLSCDAHCHVFGPANEFPYAPDRAYTPPDAGKDRLAALHKILGIERAVIVQASCHGTDNSATLDAIAHSNGRYRGVAIVNDSFTEDDFAKLDEGGIRGVRFNFVGHLGGTPDLSKMNRVLDKIRPFGWHVVLHFDAEDLIKFADLVLAIPYPFIIDHMARVKTADGLDQPPFRKLLDFMRSSEKAWVKICGAERISTQGPPFHDAVPFAKALIEAAPDRVIWGTDFPHPNISKFMPNDGDLVDLVPLYTDNDAELQHKILVDNPARLYGWAN